MGVCPMKKQIFIIDTSAILSGKPIDISQGMLLTTTGMSDEISPGGRDYRNFQMLKEKGLQLHSPTNTSIQRVKKNAKETGDDQRLSQTDIEILALALDLNADTNLDVTILTDDYSIQNVAMALNVKFKGFSQKEITQRFQWISHCPGCKRGFQEPIDICPVCGTKTKLIIHKKKKLSSKPERDSINQHNIVWVVFNILMTII